MARRILAPWEEIQYFKTPKVSVVVPNIGGPSWQPLIEANPNRVAVIFSTQGSAVISTDSSISNGEGIQLGTGQLTTAFTEKDFGPLVSAQWFLSAAYTSNVTVVEIILREMPGEGT